MDQTKLYDLLTTCEPPQLTWITTKLQLNEAFLPGAGESVATRSAAILKLVKQKKNGLEALEKLLNEVFDRKPTAKPKPRTTGERRQATNPGARRNARGAAVNPGPTPSSSGQETAARSEGAGSTRVIRIFLASSEELRQDRDAFDLYFRQQNDQFRKEGIYLEIKRWENFLDAMSETRLQNEYNKAVRDCDIFVSLFFTKTGRFTEEEFDTAHDQFKKTGRPRIYTFFKDAMVSTGSVRPRDMKSLWAFQKRLERLGHFYTSYDNIEHLKRQFRDQLEKLLHDPTVAIGG